MDPQAIECTEGPAQNAGSSSASKQVTGSEFPEPGHTVCSDSAARPEATPTTGAVTSSGVESNGNGPLSNG